MVITLRPGHVRLRRLGLLKDATIHGPGDRTAFRSQPTLWEETIHAGTGMLGLTTKHIHFAGSRKRFRVRYDKIAASGPYKDGLGIMRDAQTAKPQIFRTGDGLIRLQPGPRPREPRDEPLTSLRAAIPACRAASASRASPPAAGREIPEGRAV